MLNLYYYFHYKSILSYNFVILLFTYGCRYRISFTYLPIDNIPTFIFLGNGGLLLHFLSRQKTMNFCISFKDQLLHYFLKSTLKQLFINEIKMRMFTTNNII